jgi:hypothetical protein
MKPAGFDVKCKKLDMTTRKDVIRQASLFTMNGLVDPRLMPENIKATKKTNSVERLSFRKTLEQVLLPLFGWQ